MEKLQIAPIVAIRIYFFGYPLRKFFIKIYKLSIINKSMRKTFCDRCGKEIKNLIVSTLNCVLLNKSYDLCDECKKEFEKFMEKTKDAMQ
jgi:hypothetical protein